MQQILQFERNSLRRGEWYMTSADCSPTILPLHWLHRLLEYSQIKNLPQTTTDYGKKNSNKMVIRNNKNYANTHKFNKYNTQLFK